MIDLHEHVMDARRKREELKTKRNRLFDQFLKDPSNTLLAFEIKTIDDQVAESIKSSAPKLRIRE